MIKIEITAANVAELRTHLLALLADANAPVASYPMSAASGNGSLDKVEIDQDEGVEDLGIEEAKPKQRGRPPAAKKATVDDLKNVLTKHMGRFTQSKSVALVKSIAGVTKISEVEPKFYGPIVEAAQRELDAVD